MEVFDLKDEIFGKSICNTNRFNTKPYTNNGEDTKFNYDWVFVVLKK